MTTITATLTITIDGDGETIEAVSKFLEIWLRNDGAMVFETALRDEAQPPYDDDWDEGDDPTDEMLTY